ncbi:hypothetical protein ACHAWF_011995 [Thalassiosira exigua]
MVWIGVDRFRRVVPSTCCVDWSGSWSGTHNVELDDGEVRTFLEDGDAVIMEGWCEKEGVGRVGFGQCSGKVLPADPYPYRSPKPTKPQDPVSRAKVKEVAEIVNSGIQPLQNLSVMEAVENAAGGGGVGTEFGRSIID